MTQTLLTLVASKLRKRAEKSNGTFLGTDRSLALSLGLDGSAREYIRLFLDKIPNAEIWYDHQTSRGRTTFKLRADSVIRWYDYLAERGAVETPIAPL